MESEANEMKTTYTYSELENKMRKNGNNLADVAIRRMMDIVEEKTGNFPNWNDTVPEWIVKICLD